MDESRSEVERRASPLLLTINTTFNLKMAYPGQQWQQQHGLHQQQQQTLYQQQGYNGGGYQQQQPQPWETEPPSNWQPHPAGAGPYAYQGPTYGGNDPNYPGHQYNQQGYIHDGKYC